MHSSIRTAVYLTVHEFPQRRGMNSVESAALAVGRATGTVYNKAAAEAEGGFTLAEIVSLMLAAQDFRILHAVASACDHAAFRLADFSKTSDVELLDLLLTKSRLEGERAEQVRSALADRSISAIEVRDIRRTSLRAIAAELEFIARLEGLACA